MDVASGLVYHVARSADRLGLWAVVAALALLAVAFGAVLSADHLASVAEPVIVAPLRW